MYKNLYKKANRYNVEKDEIDEDPYLNKRVRSEYNAKEEKEERLLTSNSDPLVFRVDDERPEDTIFDEKGNTFLAMRHVSWNNRDPKLELRKWFVSSRGSEIPGKGIAFLTHDGPHELAEMLVGEGYGDSAVLRKMLEDRELAEEEAVKAHPGKTFITTNDKIREQKSYDVSTLMKNISGEEDEDDEEEDES